MKQFVTIIIISKLKDYICKTDLNLKQLCVYIVCII